MKIFGNLWDFIVFYLIDECFCGYLSYWLDFVILYKFLFLINCCIFCGLNEGDLKFLKDFIFFRSMGVILFLEDEKRFLFGMGYCIKECFFMFENMGMVFDIFDWKILFEWVNMVLLFCVKVE